MTFRIDDLSEKEIEHYLNHSVIKPSATTRTIESLCKKAVSLNPISIDLPPAFVPIAEQFMTGINIPIGMVIGLPEGKETLEQKLEACKEALEQGADRVSYVVNLSCLKAKDWPAVETEMREINTLCSSVGARCKAWLEEESLSGRDDLAHIQQIAAKIGPADIQVVRGLELCKRPDEIVLLTTLPDGKALTVHSDKDLDQMESVAQQIDEKDTLIDQK